VSTDSASTAKPAAKAMTNGFGAAAVLASGLGSFTLAVVSIAADKSSTVKGLMNFYRPTGPLSGVTTIAILVWIVLWIVLERRWHNRNVAMKRVGTMALALLLLGLLLTYPPIADLF
jgi:hypothetical protein